VSGILDVEDLINEQYDLEVSSPGPDRPLFEPEHYERYAGQKVRIGLSVPVQGRRKLTGTLLGLRGGEVLVNEDGVEWAVPLAAIGTARLVPAE
jgi:ribosome maturation factor RimP